jgi:2-succinyl-5-enolpyruvyl-6-hydroxy-3-cyclohexene-1-carboxylate synthase
LNPATALATVLVDELVRCGLTDVVLAPGSRSAPLALALHAESRVRLHVRVDERSASYLALGLAKRSERPVALICSSGTATANFHPAVIEASESGVPLLVLTADRPPELRGTGANQTIDQMKLYGTATRWFAEVGVPEDRPGQVAYWRSLACRAYQRAAGAGNPGPVHLNLAFREPLIPDGDTNWCEPLDTGAGSPWVRARVAPPPIALHIPPTRRGVLVVGDGAANVRRYVAAAGMAGWPVLSEPNGGARYGDHAISAYHYLLGTPEFADAHRPDVVVTLGRPGLSRPLLSCGGPASTSWSPPTSTAGPTPPGRPRRWPRRWRSRSPPATTPGCTPGARPTWRPARPWTRSSTCRAPASRAWPGTWWTRCRTGRCCSAAPRCRSATSTRRCGRGGASG